MKSLTSKQLKRIFARDPIEYRTIGDRIEYSNAGYWRFLRLTK